MYYVTDILTDAQKLADAQHDWLVVNRLGYSASKWGIIESNNNMGYAVKLMPELIVFMRLFENLTFTQDWSIEPIMQELIKANIDNMPENSEYLHTLLDPVKLQEELPKFQVLALPEPNYKAYLPDRFIVNETL